jgi:DNA-binding HxlR family transcriptional regulator
MKLSKVLAKAGCDDVILSLSEKEEMNFGEIAKLTNHRATATRALKELTEAGLSERRVLEDRSVRYRLTEKGKAVSKVIKMLREIETAFE